jgi:hypothetical protein
MYMYKDIMMFWSGASIAGLEATPEAVDDVPPECKTSFADIVSDLKHLLGDVVPPHIPP